MVFKKYNIQVDNVLHLKKMPISCRIDQHNPNMSDHDDDDQNDIQLNINRPLTEYTRVRRALGDNDARFSEYNTISLELDMPDRTTIDYCKSIII